PVSEVRVVAGNAGHPIKAPVVFFGGCVAVPGIEQAYEVFVEIGPEPGLRAVLLQVLLEVVGVCLEEWHGEIAGQNVVQSRNVSGALYRGVTAQCEDAPARPTYVPQHEL